MDRGKRLHVELRRQLLIGQDWNVNAVTRKQIAQMAPDIHGAQHDRRDIRLGHVEKLGDLHAGIDAHAGSIEGLLELFERHGLGDAPWPPHYRRQASEPPRVQPSRRKSKFPLIEIARARRKEDALAGVERWKARHPDAAAHLEPADILVDAMRGRYSTWTRIRINLQHVPDALRPPQEPLDPDEKMRSKA